MRRRLSLLLVFAGALVTACGSSTLKVGNLYQRLGGREQITQIVADLVVNLRADPRVSARFKDIDAARFEQQLTDQLCALAGGPCEYRGRSMADAHRGMKIDNEQFDAFIGDLAKALDQHKIGPAEQRELLFPLKAMRAEVMELPPP